MRSVEKNLVDSVNARSIALRNNTIADVIIWGSAILLVLALAFLATVAVGRSMIRPLRRLRAGALDVAGGRVREAGRPMNLTRGEAGAPGGASLGGCLTGRSRWGGLGCATSAR